MNGTTRFFLAGLVTMYTAAFAQQNLAPLTSHVDALHQRSHTTAFEENKGQTRDQYHNPRPDVLFSGMAGGLVYHLRAGGISYQLTRFEKGAEQPDQPRYSGLAPGNESTPCEELTIYRVDVHWLNTHNTPEVVVGEALPGYNNYYNVPAGVDPAVHVRTYEEVTFRSVWDGIDLHYYIRNGVLESDWILERAEDYRHIAFEVQGADLSIDTEGYLLMHTPLGVIREGQLAVYQGGKRLSSAWRLEGSRVSFEIEGYLHDQPLLIDPPVKLWITYYGGNGGDEGYAVAADGAGNVYLAGKSNSTNNIATVGAHQTVKNGTFDAFLVRFNGQGVRQWGTYYGGAGDDEARSVAVDMRVEQGDMYVAGGTTSTTHIATPGAHSMTYQGGSSDAFLLKFDTMGILQWGTYYGGPGGDYGMSCAVDHDGNVFLAGSTGSDTLIASPGAHQTDFLGPAAFLVKFSPAGVRQWGTYYGGLYTYGWSCSVDGSGNVFLAGETNYVGGETIATRYGHQEEKGAMYDAFLVKFNGQGGRLWGTYYGGNGVEAGYPSCATDKNGNVYLAGQTSSPNNIATPGSHRDTLYGSHDYFLAKFNSGGQRQWGTYYGGCWYFYHYAPRFCAVNDQNEVFLVGRTSAATGIATPDAYLGSLTSPTSQSGFIAHFNGNGTRLWGSYFHAPLGACAVDEFGNVFYTGTYGASTGFTTPGAHQTLPGGSGDAYLAKFTVCEVYNSFLIQPHNQYVSPGNTATFSVTASHPSAGYRWQTDTGNGFQDLADTGQYLGTSTNTLQVLNVHTGNTNQPFRCVITAPPCSDTSQVAVLTVSTGITKLQQKSICSVYPNPAKEQITIRQAACTHAASWELSDLAGRIIISGNISSEKTHINTAQLSPGTYLLTIHNREIHARETFKVVIR